jgi:hypothetical protein
MQFEDSFNYIYNENISPISGGFPIQSLNSIDTKFDNMVIPAGLVIFRDNFNGGNSQHYKNIQHTIEDVIDDNLFDNLINKISYREHKNTTRKKHAGSHNTTKKSK